MFIDAFGSPKTKTSQGIHEHTFLTRSVCDHSFLQASAFATLENDPEPSYQCKLFRFKVI